MIMLRLLSVKLKDAVKGDEKANKRLEFFEDAMVENVQAALLLQQVEMLLLFQLVKMFPLLQLKM